MSTRALRKAQQQREAASSATKLDPADVSDEDVSTSTQKQKQKPSAFAMLGELEGDESEDVEEPKDAGLDGQEGYDIWQHILALETNLY